MFFTKNSPFSSLHQEISLPKVLDTNKSIEILFFGYSGCSDICVPKMEFLRQWYKNSPYKNQVKVSFLDISQPFDKELPKLFAQTFEKHFDGIYLSKKEFRNYTKVFNVYFTKKLLHSDEFDHTANIYILKKEAGKKYLRFLYKANSMNTTLLDTKIKLLLKERNESVLHKK